MTQEHRKENALAPTNEDTCGPYFPIYFGDESLEDLTRVHPGVIGGASGQRIILRGRVLDRHGDLANGVVMEFWQANAKGVYRTPRMAGHADIDPWFYGYGRLRSASGKYSFRTILPGAAEGRAPNITVTLFSDGISRIVTQVFFADQPGNDEDPLLSELDDADRSRLIARPDGRTVDGAEVYRLDIVMAGENETPFFDDFES
ncbi:protocatechuate 3,4-dioxygenase [Sinorhizobium americanum]|uniref:Protocatechuate 3,4-dioxygenase alpha subunit/protocatechuate 3,4-dioxygenase beta subunit n=1 Tax=Sinorhizobium americanum TaxID=194963 RepID=A0A4R2B760_9HYPH|nr:protocatechuate 3,4-dioxygenase [Sinorhizobium americanum]TCN22115.1 protocatechuate 3,4-dioxygenase alpha subunit/protocatechuate 3,4-dioxygenase beta subunit [Sinorhizobium americanum]